MNRPLSLPSRIVLIIAAAYCFTLFVALHARATDAFYQFLWPIGPPTAAFVGAWFGALAITLFFAALFPGWAEVRGFLVAAIVASVFLLVAPAVDDRFREDDFVLGIVWYAGLAGMLIVFPVVFLYQELLVPPRETAEPAGNAWLRRGMLALGLAIWVLGLLTAVAPGIMQPRWSWRCLFPGPCAEGVVLPERDMIAVGAVMLGTGLAVGWAAVEGSLRALTLVALFAFLAATMSLFGLLRYGEYVDEGYWSTIGIFAAQGLLIVVALVTLALSARQVFRADSRLVDEPPAAEDQTSAE
ncbi:MAG: hypothetical protein WEB00_08415 [Dehalococcoidia bacterium]